MTEGPADAEREGGEALAAVEADRLPEEVPSRKELPAHQCLSWRDFPGQPRSCGPRLGLLPGGPTFLQVQPGLQES